MIKKIIRKLTQTFSGKQKSYIPLVRLEGMIGAKGYGKKGLALNFLKKGLQEAFKMDDQCDDIILVINSPGGSPSQSSLIFGYLKYLKEKYNKKVMIFIEDVAASGGYYLACAGDEIYADHHSIVGSIGVVSGGFGFVDVIKKLGIQRRVHTSGENKSMLDPFSPEKAEDIEHLKSIQSEIHGVFKDVVLGARGDKLQDVIENEVFTGKFWAAETAKKIGLIDEIATIEAVLDKRYDDDYKVIEIDLDKRGFLEKKFGMMASIVGERFGLGITDYIEQKISQKPPLNF